MARIMAAALTGTPPNASVRVDGDASLSNRCRPFDRLLASERLLLATDAFAVGLFACEPHDREFAGGSPSTSHCIVFSRTPVWIQHDRGMRYVADPTVVTFHTRGRAYRRWRIGDVGDRCDW